jgi:hypothetical protein
MNFDIQAPSQFAFAKKRKFLSFYWRHNMDSAICTKDGNEKEYFFYEFELFSNHEKEAMRPWLICPKCRTKATFVKASKSGSHLYFKQYNNKEHAHKLGCNKQKSSLSSQWVKVAKKEVEVITAETSKIEVLFSAEPLPTKKEQLPPVPTETNSKQSGKTRKAHIKQAGRIRTPQKHLSRLLEYALSSKSFLDSDSLVLIVDGYPHTPKRSFRNFFQLTDDSKEIGGRRPCFFWGRVAGVSDLTYIYAGSGKKATIILDEKIKDQVWNAWNVKHWRQVEDASMIVFGWMSRSKKNGKPVMIVKDPSKIAFLGIREREIKNKKPKATDWAQKLSPPPTQQAQAQPVYNKKERFKKRTTESLVVSSNTNTSLQIAQEKRSQTGTPEREQVERAQQSITLSSIDQKESLISKAWSWIKKWL